MHRHHPPTCLNACTDTRTHSTHPIYTCTDTHTYTHTRTTTARIGYTAPTVGMSQETTELVINWQQEHQHFPRCMPPLVQLRCSEIRYSLECWHQNMGDVLLACNQTQPQLLTLHMSDLLAADLAPFWPTYSASILIWTMYAPPQVHAPCTYVLPGHHHCQCSRKGPSP